jgi:hypothetical protein
LTICSKEVTVGTTGPMGSGLPQFGFPIRFAMFVFVPQKEWDCFPTTSGNWLGVLAALRLIYEFYFRYNFYKNQ